jgi:hypothetical protein
MRMIQIPGLEYEQYGKIIDAIDGTIPFAIIEARYNPRTKTAFIYFWDVEYIPEPLMKYRVAPPHEPLEKCRKAIEDALK